MKLKFNIGDAVVTTDGDKGVVVGIHCYEDSETLYNLRTEDNPQTRALLESNLMDQESNTECKPTVNLVVSGSSNSWIKFKNCNVTKDDSGYTIEIPEENTKSITIPVPKFHVGDYCFSVTGRIGKITKEGTFIKGKFTYGVRWSDGKTALAHDEGGLYHKEELHW